MVMEIRLQPDIVRRLRGALTQRELAARAKISRATVNRIERGYVESITLDTINALARALSVDAAALVTFEHPDHEERAHETNSARKRARLRPRR